LESKSEITRLHTEISILQANIDVPRQQVTNSQTNPQLLFDTNNQSANFEYSVARRLQNFARNLRRGDISATSMNNSMLPFTWSSTSERFYSIQIFICHKPTPNCTTSDLKDFVLNNINEKNAKDLIKSHPNFTYVVGGVALLPSINGDINQMIIQEISLNSNDEIVLIDLVSAGTYTAEIINIFISVLQVPMNGDGVFSNEDELNECYEKDQGPYIDKANGEKTFTVDRSGIGFRQLRIYLATCKKMSKAGYGFSLYLSDGQSNPETDVLKAHLQEFLISSECFKITPAIFDSIMRKIRNKSFNLLFVYSKNGQKLAQVSLSLLKYQQTLKGSASCQGFMITNETLQHLSPFFEIVN